MLAPLTLLGRSRICVGIDPPDYCCESIFSACRCRQGDSSNICPLSGRLPEWTWFQIHCHRQRRLPSSGRKSGARNFSSYSYSESNSPRIKLYAPWTGRGMPRFQVSLERKQKRSKLKLPAARTIDYRCLAHPPFFRTRSVDAGYFDKSAPGRRGRTTSSPPQLGHSPDKMSDEHFAQYVHSKEHIRASVDSGGKSVSQHSQLGLS